MRNRRLSGIIFLETLLIGILGTLTGLIASFPVIFYQAAHPIPFSGEMAELMEQYGFEPYLFFSKSPWIFNQQALTIFVITLFVSIFPVTAILRLKVNKALHT
jgi:ABC-type antimicrobial peptide transport system permease subunit